MWLTGGLCILTTMGVQARADTFRQGTESWALWLKSCVSLWTSNTTGSESTYIFPAMSRVGLGTEESKPRKWRASLPLTKPVNMQTEGRTRTSNQCGVFPLGFLFSVSQTMSEETDICKMLASVPHLTPFKRPLWQIGFKISQGLFPLGESCMLAHQRLWKVLQEQPSIVQLYLTKEPFLSKHY